MIKNYYTNKMNMFFLKQKQPEKYHINFPFDNQDFIYSGINVLHENIHNIIYPQCQAESFIVEKPNVSDRMIGGGRDIWLYRSQHDRKNLLKLLNKDIQHAINTNKIDKY